MTDHTKTAAASSGLCVKGPCRHHGWSSNICNQL